ncbi:MAG: alpha/beta hydrolase [Candidatus Methylumidiphilus sp.]
MIRPWPVLLSVIILTGCQPPPRLMPSPIVFTTGEHNPFTVNPTLEKTNQLQIFYATNRYPLGPRGSGIYTILPSSTLHFGLASVRIGPEGKPWESVYALSTNPSEGDRPVLSLESLEEIAQIESKEGTEWASQEAQGFFNLINEALAQSLDKDLTIYVHGVNTSVESAAAQAAQYHHFTGRNSVVLVFAWPSTANIFRYLTDVANTRLSVPLFSRLVELLARHTAAEHLNVLAYSAGAQIVTPGLASLGVRRKGDGGKDSLRLGEVYFAAPDVAFNKFVDQLPSFIGMTRRITVAVNLNDSMLWLSRLVNGVSRLGRPNPSELSEEASNWLVDASARLDYDTISVQPDVLPGLLRRSHSFWYDHPWVSSDVLIKFLFHVPPAARGLDRNLRESGFNYWTFPPDYDARVVEVMRQLRADRLDSPPAAAVGGGSPPQP